MRPGDDVVAGVGLVRTAKENPPDDWLYWLVWEYGLEELLPYLSDPRTVLTDGLQWQRIRGTPGSLVMAHGWLGLSSSVSEEPGDTRHWFEYQIDPGAIPDPVPLAKLVGLSRLSAPVGTRLSRVFHGYDMRRARFDECAWSDGSIYSDHSGVWDPVLGVDLSFGRTHTAAAELGAVVVGVTHARIHTALAPYNDAPAWDASRYCDEAPTRNYPAQLDELIQTSGQPVGRNLFIADGGESSGGTLLKLDGAWSLNGFEKLGGDRVAFGAKMDGSRRMNGIRPDIPQSSSMHFTQTPDDLDGWGSVGWGDRTWEDVLP